MARKTVWDTEKVNELADLLLGHFRDVQREIEEDPKCKKMPFIGKFCREIGKLSHDTLLEKAKTNEKLSLALKAVKDIQKEILITGGLDGRFQSTFAIFTAKNVTDMRDVNEQRQVDKEGKDIQPQQIVIQVIKPK